MRAAALAFLTALPILAAASPDLAPDPRTEAAAIRSLRLATCAALWDGTATVLGDNDARALAARFLAEARRLSSDADALAQERRPWMVDLLHAYIGSGDDQSRELYGRLLTDCAELQGDLR